MLLVLTSMLFGSVTVANIHMYTSWPIRLQINSKMKVQGLILEHYCGVIPESAR